MPMLRDKLRNRHPKRKKKLTDRNPTSGVRLTFRAEVMPGREPIERTFEVRRVLANGRVELMNLAGQHAISEFEPVR